jgi:hypothetical protein
VLAVVVDMPAGRLLAPVVGQSLDGFLIQVAQALTPLHHKVELFAPLLQFIELGAGLVHCYVVSKGDIPLAEIAWHAGGDEVREVVRPAVRNRLDVIDVKKDVRCFSAAVLTFERVPLEDLKAQRLRDGLSSGRRSGHAGDYEAELCLYESDA